MMNQTLKIIWTNLNPSHVDPNCVLHLIVFPLLLNFNHLIADLTLLLLDMLLIRIILRHSDYSCSKQGKIRPKSPSLRRRLHNDDHVCGSTTRLSLMVITLYLILILQSLTRAFTNTCLTSVSSYRASTGPQGPCIKFTFNKLTYINKLLKF